MEIFRCSLVVFTIAIALACTKTAGESDSPATPAAQGPGVIDPVTPGRDSVGPAPRRFEWTAIKGADHYEIELLTDIDMEVFSHGDVRGTILPMPDGVTLTPGTYFWRVGAVRDGRLVGDSGRTAFVVREP
ncbi:MAG: hypothetical protein Q7R30_13375 [Acidobacteriota bacterium]|nr:hypothetical protein [Acidobacteriota bacterium]